MKMNIFAARVSAVALCAAAFALAAPVHAQGWVFMGSQPQTLSPGANNGCSGGPTLNPGYPKVTSTAQSTSLAVASGGTGTQVVNGQIPYATYNYDQPFTVTYVWQGGGTPTSTCPVTRTDTLTASVTLGSLQAATAACGIDNSGEIATAHLPSNSPPSDTYTQTLTTFPQATGATCQFNIGVNASASGYVLVGMAYTASSTVSMAFK